MAKIKTPSGKQKKLKVKKTNHWLENKIVRIRSFETRLSPRAFRVVTFLGALFFVSIVLIPNFLSKDRFQQAKEKVLKNTNDFDAHLVLAEELLKNHQLEEAEKELLAVDRSQMTENRKPKVLGISSQTEELLKKWRGQNPEEIKKSIAEWEIFLAENPTYLPGWLFLGQNYYKINELESAVFALDQARTIDPNSPELQEFGKLLRL